jgi:hypothetical protein
LWCFSGIAWPNLLDGKAKLVPERTRCASGCDVLAGSPDFAKD